ncbi:MAG: beta-galactosidase [Cyclobacteriaceae bacterium]|nr:beta-galactosidase [Cyclobacteriaceae bacterium]
MRIYLLLLLSPLIIICCRPETDPPENLIHNPGFEAVGLSVPSGWAIKTSGASPTFLSGVSENAHRGKYAMQFGRMWSDAWEMNGFSTEDPIVINPENKYLLTFWYRTENIGEYPIPLVARLNVQRENSEPLKYQKFISTSDEWTEIKWLLDTLPPDALKTDIEFFIWIRTKGTAYIDDVELKVADEADIQEFRKWREIPAPGIEQQPPPDPFKATGYFETIKNGERWWLVDPLGQPTWAIATMGEIPGVSGNGNIRLAEWFDDAYKGNRMEYATKQYDLLQSWGINSFAGWTVDEYAVLTEQRFNNGKPWFPMYQVLNFSIMGADKDYYAKNNQGELKGVHDHSFPDPFNPEWRKDARTKAEEMTRRYKEKPWFAGWFMDNEIDYSSLFEYVWGDYSAKEFIRHLENKYEKISSLNDTWSSDFNHYDFPSFEAILLNKPSPVEWDDPLYPDFIAFERIMIREYIDYTYQMVKELDPDHLIISNRLNLDPMMSLYRTIDLWSKYDVVCVNIYPENLFMGFSKGELKILEWIHEKTGRPVIIGEWSIPAMDSGLYGLGADPLNRRLDWSWPQVVKDQQERAKIYRTCMMQLASRPYILGAAWFKVFDVDSPTRRANRGLIYGNHQPYDEFIEVFTATNMEIKNKLNISR